MSPLSEVIDRLPDRFLHIDFLVDEQMDGLRAYMADLGRHLSQELRSPVDQKLVVEVMTELGIDPASWYRRAVSRETDEVHHHG